MSQTLSHLVFELEKTIKDTKVSEFFIDWVEKNLEVYKQDPKLTCNLAIALFEMDQYKTAEKLLQAFDAKHPVFFEAQYLLSQFLWKQQKHLKALDVLSVLWHKSCSENIRREAGYLMMILFEELNDLTSAYKKAKSLVKDYGFFRDVRTKYIQIKSKLKE